MKLPPKAFKIKTTSDKTYLLSNDGACISFPETTIDMILYWLYETGRDSLNIFWNLDNSIAPILKLFKQQLCTKLHQTNKAFYRPYSLFYIPNKVFSIKPAHLHKPANFYDLQQYFPNSPEPSNINELLFLGKGLLATFNELGLQPQKLTSPIAIYQQEILNKLDLPTYKNIPEEAGYFAWQCAGKLWIEAYQLGYFEQTYDYDIISSFPNIIKDLLDTRHLKWFNQPYKLNAADYGYAHCIVTIYDTTKVSPIIYTDNEGNMNTPTGTWETYLTKAEIEFIEKWQIGTVKILTGWWAISTKQIKPLEQTINTLLTHKENSHNTLISYLAKRISVGTYGKFGEEHKDKFGRLFNPIYFAEISSQVRLQVADFIYTHNLQSHLIHVSVDGILLDKEITLQRSHYIENVNY